MARTFDARPDSLDFRDHLYRATLVEVPVRIPLEDYLRAEVPILDQGQEGACTGFGLATVVHYLLRRRAVVPEHTRVSARMLYEMARRYDEWPGEQYSGSSARGAMKGWHKHGVCADAAWPYDANRPDSLLSNERAADAAVRPLGAYARVNHRDLVAMHAALAEVGILYATAGVHEGWEQVGQDGVVPHLPRMLGGHAFALVGYDHRGFWIQNSWGPGWGRGGFGLVTYDDWLANAADVWVARLAAPVTLATPAGAAGAHSASAAQAESYSFHELRPHVISLGNDGALRSSGPYGTGPEDVREILRRDFPRITAGWGKKRLLLYAHGGLVPEAAALQRVADYRQALLRAEVYPLAFIWKSDFWTTLRNILEDALRRRRPEGLLDAARDFMLDRLDDTLEPLTRVLTGKAQWDEMKENAQLASMSPGGGAALAAAEIAALAAADPSVELHVAAHSAGSILMARFLQLLTGGDRLPHWPRGASGHGLPVETCTFWAPAMTTSLFKETMAPAIRSRKIDRFALFTLTDQAEQADHCAQVYHKSLLYLVSNALEARQRIPVFQPDGEALLGMEKFVERDPALQALFRSRRCEWVRSPNPLPSGHPSAARATAHGAFDDDEATVRATLARILAGDGAPGEFTFHRSAGSLRDRRREVERSLALQ